jgi:acyl carrier protein
MNIEKSLWDIFDNLSLIGRDENGEVVIYNDSIDSVQLISIIVDIEETFNIEIPDEYMLPEFLSSFEHVVSVVSNICNNASAFVES